MTDAEREKSERLGRRLSDAILEIEAEEQVELSIIGDVAWCPAGEFGPYLRVVFPREVQ